MAAKRLILYMIIRCNPHKLPRKTYMRYENGYFQRAKIKINNQRGVVFQGCYGPVYPEKEITPYAQQVVSRHKQYKSPIILPGSKKWLGNDHALR